MDRSGIPPGVTLANWDLGGEPSAWAYLHAGELLPFVEIRRPGPRPSWAGPRWARSGSSRWSRASPWTSTWSAGRSAALSSSWAGPSSSSGTPRMRPEERHFLMSVTKAFTSALVGILEQRGVLDLSQPVDAVIGDLAGSGWAGVPIADVLDQASGIDCPDDNTSGACTDPDHPFYRFEACLGWRPAWRNPLPPPFEYAAALPSHRRPAKPTSTSASTPFVLSGLIERVTGLPFAEVLGREIWSPKPGLRHRPSCAARRPVRRAATAGSPQRCGTWPGSGCCLRPAAAW